MKIKTNVDDEPRAVKQGSKAVLIRNKKGNVVGRKEDADYAGVGTQTLKEDRKYLAGKGNGQFSGGAAPKVGGEAVATQGGVPAGGTKKMVKQSKMRVRTNSASPQAKRSASKLY